MRAFNQRGPPIRWTEPKELLAILSFICMASLTVLLGVFLLKPIWTEDVYLLVLVPLGAILVLTSSWIYLTEQMATVQLMPARKGKRRAAIKPKMITGFPMKSALVVLSLFCSLTLAPYLLMTPGVLSFGYWAFSRLRPLQHIFYIIDDFLKPIYKLEGVYKFVLIEDVSALIVALTSLNWRRLRRIIP